MFNFNQGFLEDENGGGSSMRLVFTVGVFIVLFVWAWLSIKNNMIISFELKDLSILGMLIGGKWLQKKEEIKEAIEINKNTAKTIE